jgi:hypothetical protein
MGLGHRTADERTVGHFGDDDLGLSQMGQAGGNLPGGRCLWAAPLRAEVTRLISMGMFARLATSRERHQCAP